MARGLAPETLAIIDTARGILAEQNPMGVRGVAYQFLNLKFNPWANSGQAPEYWLDMSSKKYTNKVSAVLTTARERGLIPWAWISDDKREFETIHQWDSTADYMETVRDAYRHNRWKAQPFRAVVVAEKERGGLLRPVTKAYGLPFVVYSGFTSATAARKLANESRRDRRPFVVFYVGDFDPAGMRMSETDLPGRVERYGGKVEMVRVSLRDNHIDAFGLDAMTFPATDKRTDTNYAWFVRNHGDTCCELDAMLPNDLRELLELSILDYLDPDAWDEQGQVEEDNLMFINQFVEAAQAQGLGL